MAYDVHPVPLVQALHAAADGWAAREPTTFITFVTCSADVDLLAAHRVLTQAMTVITVSNPTAALDYLAADPRRLSVGTHHNTHEFSIKLIAALSPHLSEVDLRRLERAVTAFQFYPPSVYAETSAKDRFEYRKWNREHRLRLLRAISVELLGIEAKTLRGQEESLLPGTKDVDQGPVGFEAVGPRVTAEELALASDEDIRNLIDHLAAGDRHNRYRYIDVGRSGGVREEAAAFGVFAQAHPHRALRLVKSFSAARPDHHQYVGVALVGLAKSELAATALFALIQDCDHGGFDSDDFRESVALAVEEGAKRGHVAPTEIVTMLERWIDTMNSPVWPSDHGAVATESRRGPIVFRHGGAMFFLMHGRATVFRALAAVSTAANPVDTATLLRVLRSRIGRERHPKVYAEMLAMSRDLFTVETAIADATAAFDAAVADCPDLIEQDSAIHALADLTGYFRPSEVYQDWLALLAGREDGASRQAYGELLFLYYARRHCAWAYAKISSELSTREPAILTGLTYGAADTISLPHCRKRATNVLCAAAASDDAETLKLIEFALIPEHDGQYILDSEAERLVDAICANPTALRVVGPQMLEALAGATGTRPSLVLAASRAVLAAATGNPKVLAQPMHSAATVLTEIAITLHRQPAYRSDGLDLFEQLLALDLNEAAAALELLDRKPYQRSFGPPPHRRLRRRPPRKD